METQYEIRSEPHPAERAVTLLLNGRFSEDALPVLEHSILEAKDSNRIVYIDLSEVTLVDRRTAQYFSRQVAQNVKLVNCPIYLRRWITQEKEGTDG
jgi:ABC-type transporter Mla MlaB component